MSATVNEQCAGPVQAKADAEECIADLREQLEHAQYETEVALDHEKVWAPCMLAPVTGAKASRAGLLGAVGVAWAGDRGDRGTARGRAASDPWCSADGA